MDSPLPDVAPEELVPAHEPAPVPAPDWVRLPGRIGNALVAIITIVEEEHVAVRERGDFKELIGNTPYLRRNEVAPGIYDMILARSVDRSNGPCSELVRTIAELFRPEFIILSGIAGGVRTAPRARAASSSARIGCCGHQATTGSSAGLMMTYRNGMSDQRNTLGRNTRNATLSTTPPDMASRWKGVRPT